MKEPGQIVLFRFPRADWSEGKLRPALLLSESTDSTSLSRKTMRILPVQD